MNYFTNFNYPNEHETIKQVYWLIDLISGSAPFFNNHSTTSTLA